jgi:hypothetical protein
LLNQTGVELVGRLKVKLSFHLGKLNRNAQYEPTDRA